MTGLSRESRALISGCRELERLSPRDKMRIHGKLSERISAGLALSTVLTGAASAKAAPAAAMLGWASWFPTAAKIVGVLAMVGASAAGVVVATRSDAPPSQPSVVTAASAPRAATSRRIAPRAPSPNQTQAEVPSMDPVSTTAASAPEPALTERALAESATSTPIATRNRPIREHATPMPDLQPHDTAGAGSSAPVALDEGIRAQLAAIRQARAAIKRGDGMAALHALSEQFPNGISGPLEQEALLTRVSALCMSGDVAQARGIAQQFLAHFPRSLLAERVRNSCAFTEIEQR